MEVVLVGNEVDVSKPGPKAYLAWSSGMAKPRLEQGRCQPKRKCLSTKLGSMQLRSGQHSLVMCGGLSAIPDH